MRLFFLILAQNLCRGELICDYGENCDRLCESAVCDYFWNVEYRYSNSWLTDDYQFGALGPFYRNIPIFWNETSSRIEIPELAPGYAKDESIDDVKGEDGKTKRPEDHLDEMFFIDGRGRTITATVALYKIFVQKTVE